MNQVDIDDDDSTGTPPPRAVSAGPQSAHLGASDGQGEQVQTAQNKRKLTSKVH